MAYSSYRYIATHQWALYMYYPYNTSYCYFHFADGIDYTSQCLCNVTTAFWGRFSTEFAMVASGSAFYLGYGEKQGGTFQPNSFFAMNELPNLNPPHVSGVVAMVVHRREQGMLDVGINVIIRSCQFSYPTPLPNLIHSDTPPKKVITQCHTFTHIWYIYGFNYHTCWVANLYCINIGESPLIAIK